MRLSLFTKLMLVIVIGISGFAGFLSWYSINHETKALRTELNERIMALGNNLSYNSEYYTRILQKEELSKLTTGILKQKDVVYARIEDLKGIILAEAKNESLKGTIEEITTPIISYKSSGRGEDDLVLGTTTPRQKETIGLIRIGYSLNSFKKQINDLQTTILLIVFITFVILILLLFLMMKTWFISPIQKLVLTTQKIARGDLDAKTNITTKDEMGVLGKAVDKMTTELKDSRNQIEEYSHTLEQKVEERTKELKESEKRLSDITYSMADWIWDVDEKGIYTYCSEKGKSLLGYDSKEIIGKTPFDLMPPEEAKRIGEVFLNIVKNKEVIKDLENWNITKDGKQVCFLTSGVPILDEKGNLKGYRGVNKDITEYKKAEAEKERLQSQLLQSSKMSAIGTLAGGIAHDFNNILFVIQGNIELLKSELPESVKELHILADNIKSSSIRGAELSKKLLVFARKEQYHLEPTNINRVMKEMVSLLKRTIEKMINIEAYLDSDIGIVMADASQIHQAVLNLCINAKDAMPHGGKLAIETQNTVIDANYVSTHLEARPGKFVMISVSDTGIGMDKETSSHLFEPFFTTKERGKGTGLGLPVAYGIIKAHKGFINIYSEKGKGTCFKLYLPMSEEKLDENQIIRKEEILEKGTGTILLTDDEEQIRDLGKLILEKYGYNIILAGSGKEALEIYRQKQNEIKMVILDYIMPGWNGKETFEELRKINPDVKVLIATGYSLNSHGEQLIHEGVKGFIQKPFTIEELLKAVKEIL